MIMIIEFNLAILFAVRTQQMHKNKKN